MTSDSIEAADMVVVLEDVKKDYRVKGRKEPVRALRGISVVFEKGSMVAIQGQSGSGKTTLLQIIGALDIATSGKAIVNGRELGTMSDKELTDYRAKTIGFVFQSFNLIPNLTVFENVELPMETLNMQRGERASRVADLLESVGMRERSDYKPMKLSGGEQQRVAIARALANNPAIILADEPTGNLDTKSGHSIINLLDKLRKESGTTIIIVTHSDSVGKKCDSTLLIQDGVIASDRNLVTEEAERAKKNELRSELAITDKVLNKLFMAGYDSLEMIAKANMEELIRVTGDSVIAKRIAKKASILYERGVKYNKQLLAADLEISNADVDNLYDAGMKTLADVAKTNIAKLSAALGDQQLAKEVFERADILAASPDEEFED